MKKLLETLLSVQKKYSVLFFAILLGVIATMVMIALNSKIDAFPDFTNIQVQIITLVPGKAAEEVERLVTIPLESAVNGVEGLLDQRSISQFGLSVITLTFEDNVESRQARLAVSQRIEDASLPDGIKPDLSPDSTPIGEIYRYTLQGDKPVDELRLIEDWTLEREFKSIQGVADVNSFGGPVRQIEVQIDQAKLKTVGLSINDVAQGLSDSHLNAGGSYITHGQESYLVRSIGVFHKPEELEDAVIASVNTVPVKVRDIGKVVIGHKLRLGQVGRNRDDDVVQGIVLMRTGGDALKICQRIKEKVKYLNENVLPKGVKLVPCYDRTDLITRCTHTIAHNVLFGILLVVILLIAAFGLQYWKLILGVTVVIPFALLSAFFGLFLLGISPNLISLGAVDFGIIVETSIFAAEAVILNFKWKRFDGKNLVSTLSEVLAPGLVSAAILIVAFVPILSLEHVTGRIFRPLAITLICALIGGQLGAFLFIPTFASWVNPEVHRKSLGEDSIEKFIEYCSWLGKKLSIIPMWAVGIILAGVIGLLLMGLGAEFLPNLNEGNLWIHAYAPQSISREAMVEITAKIRERLMRIPEVVDVVSQIGRPDDGTDTGGINFDEISVVLKPPEQWKSAKTVDGFIALAAKELQSIEGVDFAFSQYIQDNIDEAISGAKGGSLALKIYGPDLAKLAEIGNQVQSILSGVQGVGDCTVDELFGQPEIRFNINRALADRYGLRVADAEGVLENALMGKFATQLVDEFGRAVDIVVKPELNAEPNIGNLKNLPILTASGSKVPLGAVADAKLTEGLVRIYRDGSERFIAIALSVRDRAVVDFVNDAMSKINKAVHLPEHYRFEWAGSFQNAREASRKLMVIIPICLAIILIILVSWYKKWKYALLMFWEIPFALIGGILALRLMNLNMSISAASGAVILVGVSFLTAMMLITDWVGLGDYMNGVKRHGPDAAASRMLNTDYTELGSIWAALKRRGPGMVISNGVAIVGLIPAAFSTGVGSEMARPFAVMIFGGLISSLLFSITVLPAMLSRVKLDKK
jgi:cobalt-zinc-cadmium resistance protein CzcA